MKKLFLSALFFLSAFVRADELPPVYLDQLKLPPGFTITVFARIPYVRQITMGDDGMIYAGSSHNSHNVYAVKPSEDFSHAEKIYTIASGLDGPIGVAYYNQDLYIGEHYRISKIPNITGHWENPSNVVVVLDNMPNPQTVNIHAYKYLRFGPRNRLYFQVGDPTDYSQSDDPHLHSIMSIKPDGTDLQVYAKGIRNTVGFDWQPITKILWFTDNGQNGLGDYLPPDEINRAPHKGLDFGFPCYIGQNIPANNFQNCPTVNEVTPPAAELDAHCAPLGLQFYTGKQFPKMYKNNGFVAEHGSFERSDKVGYQVIRFEVKNGNVNKVEPFITGWLQGTTYWGRPVDITQLPDGSILISDDYSGTIYRVSWNT